MTISPPLCVDVAYPVDLAAVFSSLAETSWSQWLDSSTQTPGQGRYSILVTEPRRRIWQYHGQVWVADGKSEAQAASASLWEVLRDAREGLAVDAEHSCPDLPFTGGVLGYLGYDFALSEWGLEIPEETLWPEAAFGVYDSALIVDHLLQRAWVLAPTAQMPGVRIQWESRLSAAEAVPRAADFRVQGPVQAQWSAAQYEAAFQRVKAYIQAGDCYQINLAQPFTAAYSGSSWYLYQHLRAMNPAAFSAYLRFPWGSVLSFSPERLLQIEHGHMQVRPIKGTRPRATDAFQDAHFAAELLSSAKDRAENVMIVDLLRNDLGKVAKIGSVRVTQLCGLESNAQVHHLVSVVEAELAPDLDPLKALAACFPGGSITGAPKRRAMEIIAELEPAKRGLYCGSIGYIDRTGKMDMNIAIRTITMSQGELCFWAGGGIVADSRVDAEYQESLDKVALFLRELAALAGLA
ncbi:aminodeoxychorismate synthase component I [Acidithiobacillus montserratensis]|uniref:Aminodeoxychorismate synthase component I n=1 Tax=Acidithiobacillus montserratensis TaxID=2729135 RepID=A0ACD5HDP0_9PROT|nr:aminodeoxychorismate synthase component I [Acidithiobacillus montserratensis]MBN2679493.1 aminodeoxychorismate synthase component I [Acidithiobacillaceae bacterium]MBU2748579.1 aminodeoxychorismate synthase component I [Acidithiobacillus montserratensis]